MRFIVEEAVTREILCRDLIVQEPKVVRVLSGFSTITFKLKQDEPSAAGIDFKAWGQFIHVEETTGAGQRIIIASGIVQPAEIDADSGTMTITAKGFTAYLDKMPWLDNYNPIAIDPFAVVQRIWNNVQNQVNGNIGVTVTPASSGTLLLPGFYFDGTELVIDFFAIFVRAVDYRDCLEEMNSLARDIPFDYLEHSAWNAERTQVNRELRLAYPRRGITQAGISFRLGENVLQATPVQEAEMDWTSTIIVRGWFPGKVHSSEFTNADPKRFRRVIKEEDALINSREQAAVRAKRRLTRRQVPKHWGSIVVEMYHSAAPFGSYEVGDDILVEGRMPFVGNVKEWHRIMSYSPDPQTGKVEMVLKHVDAFNYDSIEYEG